MYKIKENEDGTTSVFSIETGALLCTIPPKRNSTAYPKINVVGPTPSSSRTADPHFAPLITSQQRPPPSSLHAGAASKTTAKIAPFSASVLPFVPDYESSEEFTDECITQDEFSRYLNLVPARRFKSEPLSKLANTFPLRKLSQSRALRNVDDTENLKNFPDFIPLTSCLGFRLLKLNEGRNFTNDQKIQVRLKSYDSFCRWPFASLARANAANFPKLRCRDNIKTFANTFKGGSGRHLATHSYSYGRRQRLERMQTIKAGLDGEGRKLLRRCKPCSVHLKPISDEEMARWKPRVITIEGPYDIEDSNTEDCAEPLPSSSFSTNKNVGKTKPRPKSKIEEREKKPQPSASTKGDDDPEWMPKAWSGYQQISPQSSKANPGIVPQPSIPPRARRRLRTPGKKFRSHLQHQLKGCPKVVLNNVSRDIERREDGKYYVRSSSVIVPFFGEFRRSVRRRWRQSSLSGGKYQSSPVKVETITIVLDDEEQMSELRENVAKNKPDISGPDSEKSLIKDTERDLCGTPKISDKTGHASKNKKDPKTVRSIFSVDDKNKQNAPSPNANPKNRQNSPVPCPKSRKNSPGPCPKSKKNNPAPCPTSKVTTATGPTNVKNAPTTEAKKTIKNSGPGPKSKAATVTGPKNVKNAPNTVTKKIKNIPGPKSRVNSTAKSKSTKSAAAAGPKNKKNVAGSSAKSKVGTNLPPKKLATEPKNMNASIEDPEDIPLIDLTDDSSPHGSMPMGMAYRWTFHCNYGGCNYYRIYTTKRPRPADNPHVDAEVEKHMLRCHGVADPRPHLSTCWNNVRKSVDITACTVFGSSTVSGVP